MIGIGAAVTCRPLPHHRANGSLHCRLDAYALGLSRDLTDFVFETYHSLRSNRSSDLWTVCKTKPEELSLLRSRHRALRLIYLELEPLSDEARNAQHHPLSHPGSIVAGAHFAQLVLTDALHGIVVCCRIATDGNLSCHPSHGVNSTLVARVNQ